MGIDMTGEQRGAGGALQFDLPKSDKGYCITFWYYRYSKTELTSWSSIIAYRANGFVNLGQVASLTHHKNYPLNWIVSKNHFTWPSDSGLLLYAVKSGGFYGHKNFAIDDVSIQEAPTC
ncbi:uncharacterized protein LOC141898144 [Tubulanus polymorphus]|uniref:uncharacterized protein LOC141898144 n=1 Tax=Tubulanus polymorphus TaxID=672921 RepID=UPI003DA2612D